MWLWYKTKILPYKDNKIPNDFERYGDILYNFTSVFDALRAFEKLGLILIIYQFNKKQPDTCIWFIVILFSINSSIFILIVE